jgi:mRNA interferase RelE/StbE
MYRVEITTGAEHDLAQLDKQVAGRLVKRLKWLEENFERITPESLSGSLADLYKFRVGDYGTIPVFGWDRVLYDILREDQILVIHRVRHRREVYKEK